MMRSFKRTLKKFRKYVKAMEGVGSYYCIIDELLKKEKVRRISIGGTDIYLRTNTPDPELAISSLFEKEYDHIRCTNPQFIIDAGANIGTSAIFFAKKYPNARILAVEPEESNFDLLVKNTSTYKNIVPIKGAIWDVAEKRTILRRVTGHCGYTISNTYNRTESTRQEIDCVTIKTLMEQYGIKRIDLLKMDIEGSEKNVLENSADWIDKVGIMTVELHDRICMGCDRAFYVSTRDFKTFEKHADKVTAYKNSA
jgi:FkbM family methyltransferase